MKKNLIIRKRHLLTIPMLLIILCLGGCAPQITIDTYTHEAGEELPEDAAAYAEFKNPEKSKEAVVDVSEVDADKVGTYEAVITLNKKEYPFTVEVVDTTAPEGTIEQHFIATNKEIRVEDFLKESADHSDFIEGIRNVQLMYDEEQVRELMEEAVGNQNISEMPFDVDKIFQTNWNDDETHFWEEKDVSAEGLEQVIVLETDGVYSMEVVAVDIYGNANVAKVYAMVDTKAPVFTQADDIEVVVSDDFNEYLEAQEEGLVAEDNLVGDITTAVYVENMEVDGTNDIVMTITYAVNDFAGNTTSATRTVTVKSQKAVSSSQQTSTVANGHDRARAEQAFAQVNQQRTAVGLHELVWDESLYEIACNRSVDIVNDFSHNGCPDYLGENIAGNYKSINNLINGWMNSQGHKENILDSRYTAGVMACYCYNGTYYWVNLFRF